jgi:cellulose synthase/poly-beta-1,6-N-acetylglucosamine synthase-like glycosyltransferase
VGVIILSSVPLIPALLVALAAAACLGLLILLAGLQRVFAVAPRLQPLPAQQALPADTLTIVIPAYNEAANIQACLSHVLASCVFSPGHSVARNSPSC